MMEGCKEGEMKGRAGRRRRSRSRGWGRQLAHMSLKLALVRRRTTYLQMLNKTSLCQTILGTAGHSLCWGRGVRGGGRGGSRRGGGEGRRWVVKKKREGSKERVGGMRGGGEERRRVVLSLTWHVCLMSQWR